MIIRMLNDVLCGRDDFRLPRGGEIDRLAPILFRFNGVEYQGYRGDTLASALLANGVRLVGRSFKHHRPRGVLTAGSEEPNALVELRRGARREPNSRATTRAFSRLGSQQPKLLAPCRDRPVVGQPNRRAVVRRGLLLQDLYGRRSVDLDVLRALDSPRRWPGAGVDGG